MIIKFFVEGSEVTPHAAEVRFVEFMLSLEGSQLFKAITGRDYEVMTSLRASRIFTHGSYYSVSEPNNRRAHRLMLVAGIHCVRGGRADF